MAVWWNIRYSFTFLLLFSFVLLSIPIDAYTANGTRSNDMYQFVLASSTWHTVYPNTSLHTRSPSYPPVPNTSDVPPSPGTLRSPSLQAINDDLFVVGGQYLSSNMNNSMDFSHLSPSPSAPLHSPLSYLHRLSPSSHSFFLSN